MSKGIYEHKKGRRHSEETKTKQSLAKTGNKHPMFGKHLSEEHKKKIRCSLLGHKHSEETKEKMCWYNRKGFKFRKSNHKSDIEIGYRALHQWIKRRKPQPITCEKCGIINKPLELSNISGKYLRDVNDFEWACRSCNGKMPKSPIFRKINNVSTLLRV